MSMQGDFLLRAYQAAVDAKHVFPEYAACEAALESGWGHSALSLQANNLFGQKQSHPPLPGTETLAMPTREYLHGAWMTVPANWTKFADWSACFASRMNLLQRLSEHDAHYAAALRAATGEEFVTQVSVSWSTDPQRAGKVLSIYAEHKTVFPVNGLSKSNHPNAA
jgi:flagellum-specific peptidoglycan hydrolase FlgJ